MSFHYFNSVFCIAKVFSFNEVQLIFFFSVIICAFGAVANASFSKSSSRFLLYYFLGPSGFTF